MKTSNAKKKRYCRSMSRSVSSSVGPFTVDFRSRGDFRPPAADSFDFRSVARGVDFLSSEKPRESVHKFSIRRCCIKFVGFITFF